MIRKSPLLIFYKHVNHSVLQAKHRKNWFIKHIKLIFRLEYYSKSCLFHNLLARSFLGDIIHYSYSLCFFDKQTLLWSSLSHRGGEYWSYFSNVARFVRKRTKTSHFCWTVVPRFCRGLPALYGFSRGERKRRKLHVCFAFLRSRC